MDKFKEISDKLVLTDHAKQRRKDRPYIDRKKIVEVLVKGKLGFAGHLRYKKYYKGAKVVYKIDNEGHYVVISFYPPYKSKKTNKLSYKNRLLY